MDLNSVTVRQTFAYHNQDRWRAIKPRHSGSAERNLRFVFAAISNIHAVLQYRIGDCCKAGQCFEELQIKFVSRVATGYPGTEGGPILGVPEFEVEFLQVSG